MFWKNRQRDLFLGKTKESIVDIGTDAKGRKISLNPATLNRHLLVMGSSKTERHEFFLSIMEQAVAARAGGIFIDDCDEDGTETEDRIKRMVAASDPGKEVFLIDLRPGATSYGLGAFNPFQTAPAYLVADMLDDLCEHGFYDRSLTRRRHLIPVLSEALCWLRDNDGLALDIFSALETVEDRSLENIAGRPDVPEDIRSGIVDYLSSTTIEQRKELLFDMTVRTSPLFSHYDYPAEEGRRKIDLATIVRDRSYLLVKLPQLEYRPDGDALAPRLILSVLKCVLVDRLLSKSGLEQGLPSETGSGFPFLCVFEECPWYTPESSGRMPALSDVASACGIAFVSGTGDMLAMKWGKYPANSATKVVFQSEDWCWEIDEYFSKATLGRFGTATALKRGKSDNPFRSARLYMKEQKPGEFMLTTDGSMIAGRVNN